MADVRKSASCPGFFFLKRQRYSENQPWGRARDLPSRFWKIKAGVRYPDDWCVPRRIGLRCPPSLICKDKEMSIRPRMTACGSCGTRPTVERQPPCPVPSAAPAKLGPRCHLGAFYRRLSSRIGKQKAVTATARKIAVLFYNAVRHGMTYQDQGAAAYDERHRQRVLSNLQRRARTVGFALAPIPEAAAVS